MYRNNEEEAGLPAGAPTPIGLGDGERLVSLDFVRGIAVLGILAANIVPFAMAGAEHSWPGIGQPLGEGATTAWSATYLLIDGKMRSLFALLFGAGLVVFIERAEARGVLGKVLQLRRLLWLGLFGIVHFLLLFRGDILFTYALWSFIAMVMMGLRSWLLVAIGVTLYLLPIPFDYVSYSPPGPAASSLARGLFLPLPDSAALHEAAARDVAAMADGGFAEAMQWRLETYGSTFLSLAGQARSDSFPMMLIGIALHRLGLFRAGVGSRRARRWGWALAAVGLAVGAAQALTVIEAGFSFDATRQAIKVWAPLQRLPMALGWLLLLVGYADVLTRSAIGGRLVAAGRMAFTNYIAMSLVMGAIFQGWGLGLFGRFDRAELVPFVLFGWGLMLAWSKPWLVRFRFGPLEWLWRCLTYGQVFRLKR